MATETQTPPRPPRPPPLPLLNPEYLQASLDEIKARHGPPPWSAVLLRNDRFTVTAIYRPPGDSNDHHYHVVDESWYIAEGELVWEIEGQPEPLSAKAGDFILAPANHYHLIHTVGDRPSLRIAFSYSGEGHRHGRTDPPPPPVRGAANV
jgi:mannose-6-phosphate isomerase-like protein (cupin superfamily)